VAADPLEPGRAHRVEGLGQALLGVGPAARDDEGEAARATARPLVQRREQLIGGRGHVGDDQDVELPGHQDPG
jgi:hypothetical protein